MSKDFFKVKKGLNLDPTNPASIASPEIGDIIVDSSDNNKLKRYDGLTSSWKDVGSGAGGINYISNNSDFEGGTVGYATYADAAGEAPVDGTGGTATFVSIGTDSVSPLRGTKSGLISKTANNAQGQGVSYDFTIDAADQAQVLRISFDYNTEASTTNYADGDIRVYVYDVTNSRLIEVIDRDLLASSKGKFVGTFQTSPDSLSYRLIFHVASANALAYTVEIDNVIVGPQTIVKGAIVTDPVDYAPVLNFTNTTCAIQYYRNGAKLRIFGSIFFNGTPVLSSGTQLEIPLPDGLIFDNTTSGNELGNGFFFDASSVASNLAAYVRYASPTTFTVRSVAGAAATTATNPIVFASGDRIYFNAELPIAGWSSNVILSEDAGNREIYVRGFSNPTTATFDGTSALIWASISEDSTNSYNTATGTYTVPESGLYDFGATVVISGTEALNTSYQLSIYKNGSLAESTRRRAQNTSLTSVTIDLNGSLRFSKDDLIQFRINTDVGTPTIGSDSAVQKFFIAKRSSPQTIAASEVVAAAYESTAAQPIGTGSPIAAIFEDLTFGDTHSSYNTSTGLYTIPQSGWYKASANIRFNVDMVSAATLVALAIKVGSTYVCNHSESAKVTGIVRHGRSCSGIFYATKGQVVTIEVFQNSGATKNLDASTSGINNFSIAKINGVS